MATWNSWKSVVIAFLALAFALCLQGCDNVNPPKHFVGFWQAKRNYLISYQFYVPGEPASKAVLNSCSLPNISASLVCGGHGRCRTFLDTTLGESPGVKRAAFCKCNMNWADPECRTQRKSQKTAFFLSLFFGMFGIDHLYLGFTLSAFWKLISGGGFGIWWLYDICRIGSYPVTSYDRFRVSADLPHYAFVLCSTTLFLTIGYVIAINSIQVQRRSKKHEFSLMRLEEDEEEFEDEKPKIMYRSKPHNLGIRVLKDDDDDVEGGDDASQPLNQGAQPQAVPLTGYGATAPQTMPATVEKEAPETSWLSAMEEAVEEVEEATAHGIVEENAAAAAALVDTEEAVPSTSYGPYTGTTRTIGTSYGVAAPVSSAYSPVTVTGTMVSNGAVPTTTTYGSGPVSAAYGQAPVLSRGFQPAPVSSTISTIGTVTNAV